MKAVCHTQLTSPSQSLIKAICYPEAFKFVARSTSWGCDHEKIALQHYEHVAMEKHDDLRLTKCVESYLNLPALPNESAHKIKDTSKYNIMFIHVQNK